MIGYVFKFVVEAANDPVAFKIYDVSRTQALESLQKLVHQPKVITTTLVEVLNV